MTNTSAKPKAGQVVILSDPHEGSTVGLMPPVVELDDGQTISYNKPQQAMWEFLFGECVPYVEKRARNRETIWVYNGDLIDGKHHQTNQIWSGDVLAQVHAASETLNKIHSGRKWARYVVRGTATHVMESGAADDQIARDIGAEKVEGRWSTYHLHLDAWGALLDISHHGPGPGKKQWTRGNELRSYAVSVVTSALVRHDRPPDAIIRSHVHKKCHETVRVEGHRCEAIITPAFQLKTEYIHRVASYEDIADVGITILSIDNGKISDVEFKTLPFKQTALATRR